MDRHFCTKVIPVSFMGWNFDTRMRRLSSGPSMNEAAGSTKCLGCYCV